MKQIEYNLLEERWVRVRGQDYTVQEVSLTDALVHAQEYMDLAGEMPTQDAAMLRLLLAVLFTVFSRVNEVGEPESLEDEETALERWGALWELKHFPEQPIRDYLDGHFTEKISLDALAEQFFISKFYLTRVFKEQFGVSISTYLLNKRITKAKQLLRFSDRKLEDIGYQCGLGAPHYFSRVFKQVEGVTPSEFREKW